MVIEGVYFDSRDEAMKYHRKLGQLIAAFWAAPTAPPIEPIVAEKVAKAEPKT